MRIELSGFADEINPLMDVQLRVLNDLGIRFIELRGVDGNNITSLTLEETEALKKKLDANGVQVSAIGSPLGKISVHDEFEPHLALFDHVVKQAAILGTKYIRMFSFYDADEKERDEVLRRLDLFLKHTPSGLTLLHENEKGIYGNTAPRCLDLLETFKGAPLLATYDPANLIQEKQDALESFDLLKPYIAYVHVKDARMEDGAVVPAGMGDAHWDKLISRLEEMNYEGFLSLEPHLADFAGYHALEREADWMKDKSADNGEAMFRLAHHALTQLLP